MSANQKTLAGGCGRLVVSAILLVFLAAGFWLAIVGGRSVAATARTYAWRASECTVLESGVEERPGAADAEESYRFTVTYRYEVDGRTYQGDVYRPGYVGSSDLTAARRLAAAHPFGARVPCFIDPRDPGSASLARPSLWSALALVVPLGWIVIAIVGLAFLWGFLSSPRADAGDRRGGRLPQPLSARSATPRWVPGCLAAFFGVFLVAGLGAGAFFLRPMLQTIAARSWQPTPCTILYSAVRTHADDEESTYSLDVLYNYYVGGREHRSSRFQSLSSSGGYDRYADAARRFPAGSRAICFVDPADPEEAVLERSFGKQYMGAIVPLLFILVGAAGVYFVGHRMIWGARAKPSAGLDWLPVTLATGRGYPTPAAAPVELKPTATPLGKFFGFLVLCLFWNGLVSVFVWQVVQGWRSGERDWSMTLFLVPFVVVGLALVAGAVYQLLALANPHPHLALSAASLPPGGTGQLGWRFRGRAGRIRRLHITLEGCEEATYRSGKSTSTDRHIFAVVEIVDTDLAAAIPAGSASFSVPAGTMHSFAAPHNRIVWTLKVRGEIAGWPDVDEDFDLAVVPREALA